MCPLRLFFRGSEQGWFNKPCTPERHAASEVLVPVLWANNNQTCARRDYMKHIFLACTSPFTCGKLDGRLDGVCVCANVGEHTEYNKQTLPLMQTINLTSSCQLLHGFPLLL